MTTRITQMRNLRLREMKWMPEVIQLKSSRTTNYQTNALSAGTQLTQYIHQARISVIQGDRPLNGRQEEIRAIFLPSLAFVLAYPSPRGIFVSSSAIVCQEKGSQLRPQSYPKLSPVSGPLSSLKWLKATHSTQHWHLCWLGLRLRVATARTGRERPCNSTWVKQHLIPWVRKWVCCMKAKPSTSGFRKPAVLRGMWLLRKYVKHSWGGKKKKSQEHRTKGGRAVLWLWFLAVWPCCSCCCSATQIKQGKEKRKTSQVR